MNNRTLRSPLLRLVPILLLAAVFTAGARAQTVASGPIGGNWIWCSGPSNPRNAYAYFRRAVSLRAAPISAIARITADSRYILYVNGQRVGRGPVRSHAKYLAYDTYDLTPYLNIGANVIAVLVHHYGEGTFHSQDAPAGLLFDSSITSARESLAVRSDSTWHALPSAAWKQDLARMDLQLGYPEIFDARAEPAGWTLPTFSDAAWPQATVLGPAGIAPWTDLTPNDLPPPAETVLSPAAVTSVMEVTVPPPASVIDLARYADRTGWTVGYAVTNLYAAQDTDVTLQLGNDDPVRAWLNGVSVLECPQSTASAPAQVSGAIHLNAGWNRLLVKGVQQLGPWKLYVGLTGAGASGVVFSADMDASAPDTWRLSPDYPYDGTTGPDPGYQAAFPPEMNPGTADPAEAGWAVVAAPIGPLESVPTVVHYETRNTTAVSLVTNGQSLTTSSPSTVFQSRGGRDGSVLLDMGKEVLGYPTVTITGAQGGEIVDLAYAEGLEDMSGHFVSPASGQFGTLNPERGWVAYADRFVCKPGDNTFQTFDKRGFRYIQVDIRNASQPVTLSSATVLQSLYPVADRGSFACSDDLLTRIWEVGRWTLRLNMDDAYTDCPWRERAQWFGDVRQEALVNFYTYGDAALLRRALIQGAESQDDEGIVQGVYPTDWNGARIPSYSLLWVQSAWDYYLYTGDASLIPRLMPAVDRLMAFFDQHFNASLGLLEDVPYWVFIDWSEGMSGQRIGASGSLNCFYYRALKVAASMAMLDGDLVDSLRYARRAAVVKKAINDRLWSEADGLYYDTLLNGTPDGTFSAHVAALAVDYDIAPRERWQALMLKAVSDPTVVPVGTPYFSAFLLEALNKAGLHDQAAWYIRNAWGVMLNWGATTWWETWDTTGSLCHGWSTGPTRDLPAWLLGVKPLTAGWKDWELSPAWINMTWAKGTVPTPEGDIQASWTKGIGVISVQVTVPAGTVCHARIPTDGVENGIWTLNGASVAPDDPRREPLDGFFSLRLSDPGTYTIGVYLP